MKRIKDDQRVQKGLELSKAGASAGLNLLGGVSEGLILVGDSSFNTGNYFFSFIVIFANKHYLFILILILIYINIILLFTIIIIILFILSNYSIK